MTRAPAVEKYRTPYTGADLHISLDCGTILHAERSKLIKASEFFASMFKWNFQEATSKDGSIKLSNVSSTVFELVLLYLDTRKIPKSLGSDQLWELRNYTAYLGIEAMEQSCEELIARDLTPQSCPLIWMLANKHRAETLFDLCLKYFTINFKDVCRHSEYLILDRALLHAALNTGAIECSTDSMMKALVVWARFQYENDESRNGTSFDASRYLHDLLPPRTLFNKAVRGSVLGAPTRSGIHFVL